MRDFDPRSSIAIQLAWSNSHVHQHFMWVGTRSLTLIAVGRVCLLGYLSLITPVIILEARGFYKEQKELAKD